MRHVLVLSGALLAVVAVVLVLSMGAQDSPAQGGQAPEAVAQDGGVHVDVSKLGPQVGERVPDFRLLDQTGTEQTLQSLTGRRGLMLVFLRSADW